MALFSRRKKSGDDAVASPEVESTPVESPETTAPETTAPETTAPETTAPEGTAPEGTASATGAPVTEGTDPAPEAAATPTVGISVQAFRGVGAEAGPEVAPPAAEPDPSAPTVTSPATATAPASAPSATAPAARPTGQPATPQERKLPLAPALPPEQTESVPGMKDNVLLREALAQIEAGASNEQLLGVLRQALQSHLFIRVNGDAREQISEGKPLAVAVVRDGDRQFMLAFSSAAAVRDSVQLEGDPSATSAVAQPSTSVMQHVVAGEFAGLIIDNASAPHRVVFPTELLEKTLEQADTEMTVKSLIAGPRAQDTPAKVGEALATTRMWVAVNDGSGTGQVGIAEAQTADGRRFLQLFSHPLEVIALGRGDRPLPFEPEQLAKVLTSHAEMAGVIVDSAGPSIVVERDALAPVLVRAVQIDD
ncbi:SseB family protein [Microbacterium sufflavum]|uniref:SseB family protein n=1 Tax=Microbacterium sufflavum TaxID=2851649 RepID=A0ABY4IF41_9MICO|nr:SseB family protein [Microbacterium sufflavum]UPL11389.1 SseB family protein [Microbacterium sufflavum]